MTRVREDLRFGVRLLARSPGFTATALLTLALGVGLNSAIFSMVSSILLDPLPYPDSGRMVVIDELHPQLNITDPGVSPANLLDWRARSRSFEEMALYHQIGLNLTGAGEPERVEGTEVTAGLFPLLRARPALGRLFGPEEDRPGAGRSVVLSWGLWKRRFGGDASAVGRAVAINGKPFTVAGVMPAGFALAGSEGEAWVPMEPDPNGRGWHGPNALAKLKPGVSLRQAQVELEGIEARLAAQYPEVVGWHVRLTPWHDRVTGPARTPLLVLMGAVAFVLLIACANVANLLLARAPARRREIAVRTALGAGRARIVRQLLAESLLLGGAGGLLGLAAGSVALTLLKTGFAKGVPRVEEVRMDAGVLAFTLALALVAAVVFGLVPAFETSRTDLAGSLREGGRGGTGRRGRGLRSALVVGED